MRFSMRYIPGLHSQLHSPGGTLLLATTHAPFASEAIGVKGIVVCPGGYTPPFNRVTNVSDEQLVVCIHKGRVCALMENMACKP